ncbi:hypothetical protein AQUCO_04100046v1 [Aquilegia coerulea]|uniref:Uncharacterized protein n=1 Tax=Aquilegia coerulea TaxID=218851 RepID=A0A2G5CQ25_AQUCA|nr:hypothetical protein AQUCO_04100046v1 [Aquilegia coerulea]
MQNQLLRTPSTSKLYNNQFHLLSHLSYFLFFGLGLAVGTFFSFYLKSFSFNLQVTQFSLFSPLQSSTPPSSKDSSNINENRIGLKEYIKGPSLMHDMDDNELLWRASMVPKITEVPYKRVPKVAFMFLTRGEVPFAPLWEKFFKGHEDLYSIYVHPNPSFNGTLAKSPIFQDRRIPSEEVQWGTFSMLEAERRLIANALLDFSNQRFILLSESCIPLFNFTTVYSYLMNSSKSFVEVYDLPGPVGRGRYNPRMKPHVKIQQWRKGSQWFEMDRSLAIEIISDRKYFPLFGKYCLPIHDRTSCYVDEHYIPTFVYMKHSQWNSNRTLTWVDWSKGGPHPTRYSRTDVTVELLDRMRSGKMCEYNGKLTTVCYLFARKFMPNTLDRLLRFAPTSLGFN